MNAKENKLGTIALAVLVLEVKQGHLKWKVTDLSRRAGCSRTLVYQYLGATKPEILRGALQVFLAWLYGAENAGLEGGFAERVTRMKEFLTAHPEPIQFYQKWRVAEGTWIQGELARAEKGYRRRLKRQYPALSQMQIKLMHALLHGLVTAPFLSAQIVRGSGREMEALLGVLIAPNPV